MTLLDLVLGNLRRRIGRMAFIVAGLAIGVGTVVALRSITASIEQEIGAELDQYGANIVVVPSAASQEVSYGGITISAATFDIRQLNNDDIRKIKSIPYAKRLSIIAPKLLGSVNAEGQKFLVSGIDFDQESRMKKWWQISGHVPSETDEILLGYDIALRLGMISPPATASADTAHHHASQPNSEIELLRSDIRLDGQKFRIAGVLRQTGAQDDQLIYLQLRPAQVLLHKSEQLSLIEVSALCNGCPIDDIVMQIGAVLPEAKVSAVQQAVRARVQTVERLSCFSTAISIVMLFVGFLMVFVTMMASVSERTREIGVLRAIGFRRSHIMKIFVIEAVTVSCIGGLLGWAAGTLSGVLAARYFTDTGIGASPSLSLALAAVAAAVLTGSVSSMYPAIKASRLDPTESLRYI